MSDKTKIGTRTGPGMKLELTGVGLSANIDDLTFGDERFGATFSMWIEVPIVKLEEIGIFVANTCRSFEDEIPEEIYDKKWKVTIEECDE